MWYSRTTARQAHKQRLNELNKLHEETALKEFLAARERVGFCDLAEDAY
jgi:hypothetical protein